MLDMVCMEIIFKMEDCGKGGGAVFCGGSSYIQVHAIHLHKLQNNHA